MTTRKRTAAGASPLSTRDVVFADWLFDCPKDRHGLPRLRQKVAQAKVELAAVSSDPYAQWEAVIREEWRSKRFVARRLSRVDYDPLFRGWYKTGRTPQEAFALFQQAEADLASRYKMVIEQNTKRLGLTRSALHRFLPWSHSAINAYRKDEFVGLAYEAIALGEGVLTTTVGRFRQRSCGSGWDILVDGPAHTVAYGQFGCPKASLETFQATALLRFSLGEKEE